MIVKCPQCGEKITVKGLGRPRLNIPLIIVCESLQTYGSVPSAAKKHMCSQAYIYKILKTAELTVQDVIKGKVTV